MAKDPAILAHQEWLGYVQPVGLVVSIPAMLDANLASIKTSAPDHRRFIEALPTDSEGAPNPEVADFPHFAQTVLGWSDSDLYGAPGADPLPEALEVPLPDYNETLRPTYALREFAPVGNAREWILLVKVLPEGRRLRRSEERDSRHWQASPQAKFERLFDRPDSDWFVVNGRQIRLVYAPEKELSGYITFNFAEMVKVAGRPIFAAFHMLLIRLSVSIVSPRENACPRFSKTAANTRTSSLRSLLTRSLKHSTSCCAGFRLPTIRPKAALARCARQADPTTYTGGCSPRCCEWSSFSMPKIAGCSPSIGLRQVLLDHRASTSGSDRRWPLPRHHGSAFWRVGAIAHILPAHLPRR